MIDSKLGNGLRSSAPSWRTRRRCPENRPAFDIVRIVDQRGVPCLSELAIGGKNGGDRGMIPVEQRGLRA